MQDRTDAGQARCGTGQMYDRTDKRQDGCRTGQLKGQVRSRTGWRQDRTDA